jgi:hypothetical protein
MSAGDLEPRRAHEEGVQPRQGFVFDRSLRAEVAQPGKRLLVQARHRRGARGVRMRD